MDVSRKSVELGITYRNTAVGAIRIKTLTGGSEDTSSNAGDSGDNDSQDGEADHFDRFDRRFLMLLFLL
jgi:hypothetical protein